MATSKDTEKRDRDSSPVRIKVKSETCVWCKSDEKTQLEFNKEPVCFSCLRHLTPGAPRLHPYKFDSCENCNNDYCFGIHLIKKSPDEGFQCCACYHKHSSWTSIEDCFACFRRPPPKRKWTTLYFSHVLECDMPILESLYASEYQPWHECISLPRYNLLLVAIRRCEFDIIHYHVFQSEITNHFCGLLRMICKYPVIKRQVVFHKFAEWGTHSIIAQVDCALSLTEGLTRLFGGMKTVQIFVQLLNTLSATFPDLLPATVVKLRIISELYNVDPHNFNIEPAIVNNEQ
jgi:hypothetical protein